MVNKEFQDDAGMRADKWLWCARFFKSRALAVEAIKKGKVKIEGQRVKPSQIIRSGQLLSIRSGPFTYDIRVTELSKFRKSAAEAVNLYVESTESIDSRRLVETQLYSDKAMHPYSKGRPAKRERRKLTKFKKTQGT